MCDRTERMSGGDNSENSLRNKHESERKPNDAAGQYREHRVLPWLDLRDAIRIGDVTFLPAEAAEELLGARSALMADRLRIYRDTWGGKPVHATIALHDRQLSDGGSVPEACVRRATDILMSSSIFENDGGPHPDVNATTYTLYFQRLGGEIGFMAMRARRRYGGFVTGSTTDIQIVRPVYAGSGGPHGLQRRDSLSRRVLPTPPQKKIDRSRMKAPIQSSTIGTNGFAFSLPCESSVAIAPPK